MARLFREVGPGHLAWLRPAARRVGIRVRSAAMELARAIRLRRSTREFLAREVPPSLVKRLLDLTRRAPSSMDGQPWHFVVVRDPAIKQALADIKNRHCPPEKKGFPSDFVARAPVVVVICVDVERS